MIRIGLIDDDREARVQLKQVLSAYASEKTVEYELEEYDSAPAFLKGNDHFFDLLFLDIDMPEMSGMELAEKIRESDQEVVIVFCTNLQQFALNGYSVGALGFLIKPVETYAFGLTMDRARSAIRLHQKHREEDSDPKVMLKDGTISRLVSVSEIDYMEVRQHYLLFNITDKKTGNRIVIKNRGSMQEALKTYEVYGFVRCSSSFLVNLKSITAVSRMNVYVGEEVLPIGRAFKESFTETFSRYLAKRGWEDPCQ
ncbi:MAG: LytTR family DNA-binding domain-containing protein [Lachnospiraceae bacterium]|nr:LytTR family DNA-binding domain-containing protein [Lachnospiraceae bacterium]